MLPMQKAEAAADCNVINIMTHLGMPVSEKQRGYFQK